MTDPSHPARAARDPYDRVVYATSSDKSVEVVRYDKAGRWWREEKATAGQPARRDPLRLATAVSEALLLESLGGRIREKRAGGMAFDAAVRRARQRPTPTLPA